MKSSYLQSFFALLFFFSLNNYAQDITFDKGEELKDRLYIRKKEMTTVDEHGNFISVRPKYLNGVIDNYYIEFYNKLNFEKRVEIETTELVRIVKIFSLDNKAYVVKKEINRDYVDVIIDDINVKQRTVSQKSILKVFKKDNENLFKALRRDQIDIEYDSNIVITFPVREEETTHALVNTFDKNFDKIAEDKVYPDKQLSPKKINYLKTLIGNEDTFYLLFNIENKDKNNLYKLVQLKNSETKTLDIPIENDVHELINSKIKDDNYLISGLYSKKEEKRYEGYTHYNINLKDFQLSNKAHKPFVSETVKSNFEGFFKKKRHIDMNNIYIDDNLNTYLVGQLYIKRKQTMAMPFSPFAITAEVFQIASVVGYVSFNPMGALAPSYKIYDDLLVTKISPEGNIVWDNLLEFQKTKSIRATSNHRDSSYFTYFKNNEVNLLLNGSIDTSKNTLEVKQDKRKNKTNFYNITISKNADISSEILFPNEDSKMLFRAEKAKKANDKIYILGQGNMRKQLLKINL